MTRDSVSLTFLGIIFLMLFLVGLSWGSAFRCEAQTEPDHVLLARIWVSEKGWDDSLEEVAIWQVLEARRAPIAWMLRRGRPVSLRAAMRAYAPRATGRVRVVSGRQRWVSTLRSDGRAPAFWRELTGVGWGHYEARWLEVLSRARARLAGEDPRPSPCAESPEHWGSPTHPADRALARRALRAGRWIEVDCGEVRNRFFRVRRRSR
jgi:hypothetical protein